jgi:beta-alanine degradation protein BauB
MNMKKAIITFIFLMMALNAFAQSQTKRIPQFSNAEVNVWQTIIYPQHTQMLKMHRHQYNRIVVAFTDGTLKIVDNKNKVQYLKLQKKHAYYLTKDALHIDENMSSQPIKVLVIELKK